VGWGHAVIGMGIGSRRSLGLSLSLSLSWRSGRRRVMLMILRGRHARGGQQRKEGDQKPDHAGTPSSGRTVTTLNMPACMCISMWQWKAQSPGASAVRSNVTFEPGATLTVCFSG